MSACLGGYITSLISHWASILCFLRDRTLQRRQPFTDRDRTRHDEPQNLSFFVSHITHSLSLTLLCFVGPLSHYTMAWCLCVISHPWRHGIMPPCVFSGPHSTTTPTPLLPVVTFSCWAVGVFSLPLVDWLIGWGQ